MFFHFILSSSLPNKPPAQNNLSCTTLTTGTPLNSSSILRQVRQPKASATAGITNARIGPCLCAVSSIIASPDEEQATRVTTEPLGSKEDAPQLRVAHAHHAASRTTSGRAGGGDAGQGVESCHKLREGVGWPGRRCACKEQARATKKSSELIVGTIAAYL